MMISIETHKVVSSLFVAFVLYNLVDLPQMQLIDKLCLQSFDLSKGYGISISLG
jgi:hypothetical protein